MLSVTFLQFDMGGKLIDQSWQYGPFIGLSVALFTLLAYFIWQRLKDERSAQAKFEKALTSINDTIKGFFENAASRELESSRHREETTRYIAEKLGKMGDGLSDLHDLVKDHEHEITTIKRDIDKLNSQWKP